MPDLAATRRAYAHEIRALAGLRSERLVDALARVPREHFLGPGPWKIVATSAFGRMEYHATPDADPRHLYADVLVAIDAARGLNNGQPSGLTGWIDRLGISAGDRILHVGCGTGYYTALIAELAGSSGHVTAAEIDESLAARARANLAPWTQVTVVAGDGASVDAGPLDAVFVNAGATHVRPRWLDALRDGGRLLVPITTSVGVGGMFLIERDRGRYPATCVSGVAIFPCKGSRDPALEGELSRRRGSEQRVRSLRRDRHRPDAGCWLHRDGACLSTEPAVRPSE